MEPIVSFSTNTTELVESENSVLTFNFEVKGDIPEGGLAISLKVDANLDDGNQWFFDFDAGRPSINNPNEGDVTLTPFARNAEGIGGRVFRGITILPSVEPPNDVINLVITENTASFDLPIFDDEFAERGETVVFTLQDGEGYTVHAETTPAAISLQDGPDGVIDATTPVVSLSVDQTTVTEGETFTVNFDVEGEIPEGGLTVYVDGDFPGGLSEFAVDEVVPVGAGFPGPDGDAGGFVVTLTENQASLTLPVFKDGLGEGVENLSFTLIDGELYEAKPGSNQVTLTIEETAPTVSIDTLGGTFDGSTLITPNLVETSEDGTAVLSISLKSDAPVPEEGLIVNVNSDIADITKFVEQAGPAPEAFGGEVIGAIYNDEGKATGFQVRMDQPNTVINFTDVSLEAEGAQDVTFTVEAGEGYELSSEMSSSTITVYDSIEQVPAPTSTPEVGISISTDELREGRGAATINFTVNGDIPEEGVVVYVNSGVRAGLGEFDLFNAGISGGAFPSPDGRASGFYFKITEPTASITLQAVDDDIQEGLEALTFSLEAGPGYTIASDAGSDSLIIADGRSSEIQVSLEGEPQVLVEAKGTFSTHTISLSAPPPDEGLTVRISAPNLDEFDLTNIQLNGATLAETGTDEAGEFYLDLSITEQTATVELPVANDGVDEGLETAEFTLQLLEGQDYQIDPEASSNSFIIVDTAEQEPLVVEDDESNDTIDTAIATGLSADNNVVSVDGSISFSFRNNRDVDQTEDVDMYSFELKAGDTVTIDIDSIPFEQGGFEVEGGADLRLFNADGEELVYNSAAGAPDELFAAGRDAYIEYTATVDGTYYVGVSQAFNENYDPKVKGTGDGAKLVSRGLGAGPYNLEIKLNPSGPGTETYVQYEGDPSENAPVVTFNAVSGTFDSGNNIVSSQIVESVAAEGRNSAALTLSFAVDGEIPEGGLEVIVETSADFRDYFADVSSSPRTGAGGQIIGAVYNADGSPAGIKVLLTSANASFPLTISDRDADDPNAPETVTFSLANSPDYAADGDANSTEVTFYDNLDQVTSATAPEIGITINETEIGKTELVESEGTELNVTFNVTGDIPDDGILVYVDSETRSSIGEFDVFNAEITGASFPTINNDASGFYLRIFEDGANIKLNVFDETTNPEIPAEDALEGVEEFTFSLVESGDYTVKTDAASVTYTIKDNPDSVVIDDGGDDGGDGGDEGGPTDNDGRSSNNDTIAGAVDLGLTATNPTVTVDGEIAQRFRGTGNTADASEDVDMYSFTLEAGQTIILDVDAGGAGGVEGSLLDSELRIFDADGVQVDSNRNAPAPDEVFQSNGDPYLEFTATEAGTYYVGISNLGNTQYDPNVANSGSGWTFDGRFEPGPYKLNATLEDAPPVVSFEVTPENLSEEAADNLVEWKWTVTGEFPEEGITVNIDTSGGGAPFAFLDQFAADSESEFINANIVGSDETGRINILLTEPEASFKLYFGNDILEEKDEDQTFDFFLVDGDGYTVDPENNGTTFTITDDNGGIGVGPTVGLTVSETNLAEGDEFTVNFKVTGDIPEGGVQVLVQSDVAGALGQFDIADLSNLNLDGVEGLEVGDSGGSSFLVTITKPEASITLSVFDDIVAEDAQEINFTLANGELYQIDPSAETVTLNISDEEIPGDKPTVSISVDETDLVEGETVTLSFAIDGEIPAEGVTVLVNDVASAGNGARSLTEFDVSAVELSSGISFPEPAEGDSGFFVTITEANASITLPVFDDNADEIEADEVFTFEVIDGEAYEVNADAGSVTIDITDAADVPVVSLSTTTTTAISEAEGNALVLNFSVEGDIPPDGITVNLEGDAARIMQQFTAAQTRFNGDGETFNRFDKGLVNNNVVGGTLELFSLEDGDPSETASNPEAAGDAYLTNFSFTITEPTASITIPVFDDLIEEADATYTYTLVEGGGYKVDDTANSSTFTVTDGVVGGGGPTVGVSATPTTLIESEQTAVTLTFTTDGDIPEGGVVVVLEGPPRAIAEFDINATNPRNPESETVVEGLEVTGGNIVGTNEVVGALLFRITDSTATITVPVYQDEIEEGTENLTFNLKDGELYNVDQNASAVSVKIEDVTPPVVSFSTTTTTISEAEGNALVLNFSVDGDIPPEGITVNLEGDAARIMEQFTAAQTRFDSETGEIFYRFDKGLVNDNVVGGELDLFALEADDESSSGFLSNFSFKITEQNASITIPVIDDIIEEEDATYTYTLVDGDGYKVDDSANSTTFTVTDGVVGGEGPRVEISATPGTLYEKDATEITINLRTRGDIPEDGLVVFIEGSPRAIAEFDVNATNPRLPEDETVVTGPVVTGGSIVGTDETAGGLFFRITESSSSITVPVFQDDVEEGSETFTFTVRDGEEYQVREGRESVTVTIDDVLEPPVVSMDSSSTLLKESDGSVLELNFSATGTIPESGTTVVLEITNPDLLGIQIERPSNDGDNVGIEIPSRSRQTITDEDGNFVKLLQRVTITESNATLRIPVADDIFLEEDTEYTINLVDGEGYDIDAAATNSATFTISDGDVPAEVPTIGVSATPNNLYESEQTVVTLSFNVEGDIPAEGIEVFIDSDIPAALGEFDINGSARTGEVEGAVVSGGEIIGTDNDSSGFFFRINDANATIEVPVFPDDEVEGAETFTFALAEGEAYNVDADASAVSVTIDDVAPVVSLSITPDEVSEESPNNAFTATFTVDGEIPPAEFDENGALISGGLQVLLDVKEIGALGEQFDDFTVDGLAFGSYSDPERPTVVSFVLLENTSSITLTMFEDIIEEQPFDFNFELLEDTGNVLDTQYTVTDANSGSFTLIDGNGGPGVGPTVGISVSETELTEGDELTLNFDVDGDIPDEGLQVVVQSPTAGALGEFAIFDENGNFAIESQGIAGDPIAYDGEGSSFLVTLTEPDASLTLKVFNDGPGEDTESLTFNLVNGEAYEVNADAASVSLNITDVPEVSFSVNTTTLSEEEGTLFTFSFSVNGPIPEGGLEVALGGDLLPFIDQLDFSNFDFSNPDNVKGLEIGQFGEDGAISLTLLEPSASVSVRVFDDIIAEQDANFDLILLDGDGYSVNQEAKGETVIVTDGVIVDNPPTVALSVDKTNLNEGEELTVNFSVDGDVSAEEPLTVLVSSTQESVLGEFNIFNEDGTPAYTTTGIQGEATLADDTGSSFFVELIDTEASITLSVFEDGSGEGTETFNFEIVDGERYDVDATNNQVALTIEESAASEVVQVGENGEVTAFAYQVTGVAEGETAKASISEDVLEQTDAAFDNLVGFYEVVDAEGGIDTDGDGIADVTPEDGPTAYAKAALAKAVDGFALNVGGDASDNTSADEFDAIVEGGKFYSPFVIANGSSIEDFLAANPDNNAAQSVEDQVAYFAFGEANPDGANHLHSRGNGVFGFEDLPANLGVSDNDFNDAVFAFNFNA